MQSYCCAHCAQATLQAPTLHTCKIWAKFTAGCAVVGQTDSCHDPGGSFTAFWYPLSLLHYA